MRNKKFLMSSLAALAMVAVVGSGFAVWNFDNDADSVKGIYNLGIYVTPEVSTIGSVSTNNDYALILDQGALTQFSSKDESIAKEQHFGATEAYYKRGIYVGKLKKKEASVVDSSSSAEFETYPNGSYVYEQVPSISGYWIQEMADAQSIVAENVNEMSFTTSIKLREDLARYVQVRNDYGKYVLNNTDFVVEKVGEGEDAKNFNYVEYNYNWGKLDDVLKPAGSNYRITKTFKEIYDLCDLDKDAKFIEAMDTKYSDSWQTNSEDAPRIDDLQNVFRNDVKLDPEKSLSITEDDCYNTTANGLTLRGHKALKVYAEYVNKEFVAYHNTQSSDCSYVPMYFMNYDKSSSSEDNAIKDASAFANLIKPTSLELVGGKDYTEVISKDAIENKITVGDLSFDVVECYYFKYYLTTTNYGPDGDPNANPDAVEEGADKDKKYYENARFIYYPQTSYKFKEAYDAEADGETKPHGKYKDDFVQSEYAFDSSENSKRLNTLTDRIDYVKKPANDKEYEVMFESFLKNSGVGGSDKKEQVVDLNNRYVIVEFGSNMTTKGSNGMEDPGLPGPEMG